MADEHTEKNVKDERRHRTKSKAGDIVKEMPHNMAVITNSGYQNGLSLNQQGQAYLQPLSTADGLRFEGGVLYFKDIPASQATLQDLYTKKGIDNIDLPLLRIFYSIILSELGKCMQTSKQMNENVLIYMPDLASFLGKGKNLSKTDIESIVKKLTSFQTVMGIIKNPDHSNWESIMPVFVFLGYDSKKNTVKFSSPYMNMLIQQLYDVSIKKDKKGQPKLKSNGQPMLSPSHSYLIHSDIAKERNKKAVEIVTTIVVTIERAGGPRRDEEGNLMPATPNLKARTIIERNPLLLESIETAKSTADKNKLIKRAFSKAWEMLRTKTDLQEKYKDIKLPDPNKKEDIPTMSTLDRTFTFTHFGKKG